MKTMTGMLALKRPFIWLKRFRHRCGYGVHSPFAFDFITSVINESAPYYAYHEIESSDLYLKRKRSEPKKLNRLLFRVVNRLQPTCMVEAGPPSAASMYLQVGCKRCKLYHPDSTDGLSGLDKENIDFLYIPYTGDNELMRDTFYKYAQKSYNESVFVMGGIGYSAGMKNLWNEIKSDTRTGITFDLYDAGIVFFDKTRIKQHYIVNF